VFRRVKPRVSLARERESEISNSFTHTHTYTHTHTHTHTQSAHARARTIRIGHARNQLERDMRDCSTRQTHALARSIIQVAARRDAAPIAFGYGRARTKELPGREGGGSRTPVHVTARKTACCFSKMKSERNRKLEGLTFTAATEGLIFTVARTRRRRPTLSAENA